MFGTVFRYELRYHLRRPVTWLYFGLFAAGSFALVTTDVIALIGGSGQVMRNAPWVIVRAEMFVVSVGMIVVSGLVGTAILRDYQYRTHELLFTTPITKFAYLGGRFFAAFLVMVIVHSGMVVGLVLGAMMPWLDPARILPVDLGNYIAPFFVLVVPAVLVISTIFFAVGALTRSSFAIYTQGIILLVAWSASQTLANKINNQDVVAMLDPIGTTTFEIITRYWTVAEKNTQSVALGGLLLLNRITWSLAALGLAALTYALFRFRSAPPTLKRRRKAVKDDASPGAVQPTAVTAAAVFSARTWWTQVSTTCRTTFLGIVRQSSFAIIVAVALINLGIAAAFSETVFGQRSWPVTYTVVEVLNGQFMLFFIVLIALYAGDVVWRERELGMDQITDAIPAPVGAILLGKIGGLVLVEAALLLLMIVMGVLYQAGNGYYRFELPLYFAWLYGTVLPSLIQLTILAVLIHVLVNQKYLGHALVILFFVLRVALPNFGLEHPLFQYARGAPLIYSDMNGVGPYLPGVIWNQAWWFGIAALLVVLGYLTWIRGSETSWPVRRAMARQRLTAPVWAMVAIALAVAVLSGGIIVRNARINGWRTSRETRNQRIAFERTWKSFAHLPQPKLIDADIRADLEPERTAFTVSGTFTYVNNHPVSIDSILVSTQHRELAVDTLAWGRPATLAVDDTVHRVRLYRLESPLAPSDTIALRYRAHYAARGFPVSGLDTAIASIPIRNAIARNGAFVNYEYFPTLGYLSSWELPVENERRKAGLPPKTRMPAIDNDSARATTYLGVNADWISFKATVSTAPDQIAIAPGYPVREYTENGRRVFEYQAREPMMAFWTFLSAKYEVKRDRWNDVNLEIYYHKGHEFNVDRMMESLKASLEDFSTRYSPYQFRQMRIIEFPRYSQFAQAFPATVPFGENIGFILRAGTNTADIDTPYYVTSHEVAHQWWFHQVVGGNVQGATMLSEALANYSAIMVMEKTFGRDNIRKFLRQQLDGYLAGRGREAKAEQPLMLVENQPYIHYNKGSLALYALRDLIGDSAMTRALSRFVKDKAFQAPPFTTSREMLGYLEAETPDSLKYILEDLFRTITLWDNAVEQGTVTKRDDGRYDVTIQVRSAKFRADSLGNEEPIAVADYVDIGVFGDKTPDAGVGKPLYMQKQKITDSVTTIQVVVDSPPRSVGVDPYNKLIDRNPRDNLLDVRVP